MDEKTKLDQRGDIMALAVATIGFIVVVGIGYLLLLYIRSTLGSLTGLTSADNQSLYNFVGQLISMFTLFVVAVLVVIGGIIIWVLRTFGGGGRMA